MFKLTLFHKLLYAAVLIVLVLPPAHSFNPTPVRISFYPDRSVRQDKTTAGLDLGIVVADTNKLYGVQAGIIGSNISGKGYGLQLAGLATYVSCSGEFTFYGVQLAGLANNFSMNRTTIYMAGIQIAGIVNIAGDIKGIQLGAVNDAYSVTGIQLGLFNYLTPPHDTGHEIRVLQLGAYNKAEEMNGLQFGLSNNAENVTGIQLGVINRAIKLKGLQLGVLNILANIAGETNRVVPVLNFSW